MLNVTSIVPNDARNGGPLLPSRNIRRALCLSLHLPRTQNMSTLLPIVQGV